VTLLSNSATPVHVAAAMPVPASTAKLDLTAGLVRKLLAKVIRHFKRIKVAERSPLEEIFHLLEVWQ